MTDKTSWTLPLVAFGLLLLGGAAAVWLTQDSAVDPVLESGATLPRQTSGDGGADEQGRDEGRRAAIGTAETSSAPATTKTTGSMRVDVVWNDGSPAPNVAVLCRAGRGFRLQGGTRRSISDTDGLARIKGLPPIEVSLRSDHGGHSLATVVAGQETTVRFMVPRGVDVTGIVVGDEGTPVSNANIWLTTSSADWLGGRVVTRSGPDGRFAVRSMPKGMSLGAMAAGWQRSDLVDLDTLDTSHSPVPVRLRLRPGGSTLVVRVVTPDQRPVPGALVAVGKMPRSWMPRPGGGQIERWTPYVLATDELGQVRMHGIPEGEQPLCVRAEGFPIWKTSVRCQPRDRQQLLVVLQRPVVVHGVVCDTERQPVARALVRAVPEAFDEEFLQSGQFDFKGVFGYPMTETGADGRYRLEGVAPGEVHLHAMRSGRRVQGMPRVRASTVQSAPQGASLRWDAILDPGHTIAGVVTYRDGKPMVSAFVTATETKSEKRHVITTGKEGRFRMTNLGACSHTVSVQLPSPPEGAAPLIQHGVWPDRGELRLIAGYDAPVELASGSVSGSLQDVALRLGNPPRLSFVLQSDKRWWMMNPEIDGMNFRFDRVRPGRYKLIAKSGENLIAVRDWFVVEPGQELRLGPIRTAPSGSLVLRLDRSPGTEQVQPGIYLRPVNTAQGQNLKPGKEDELRVPALSAGSYVYTLRGKGIVMRTGELTITAGRETQVRLPLIPGALRKIEIRWPASEQGRLSAQITDAKGEVYWHTKAFDTRTRNQLRESWIRLPLGSFVLEGETTSGAKGRARFEMKTLQPDQPMIELELR